ncbi:MAG: thiamine pyrophosphate-dependent enzyme, partial [Candidatus Acidiferrum sp.]
MEARTIIHLDNYPCDIDNRYQPELELRGAVPETVAALTSMLQEQSFAAGPELQAIHAESMALAEPKPPKSSGLINPLSIVLALRSLVDDDTIVACDMGSVHIWMGRHFFAFEPRKLLFTNGQQTLGVGIPWAMAASLTYPA